MWKSCDKKANLVVLQKTQKLSAPLLDKPCYDSYRVEKNPLDWRHAYRNNIIICN